MNEENNVEPIEPTESTQNEIIIPQDPSEGMRPVQQPNPLISISAFIIICLFNIIITGVAGIAFAFALTIFSRITFSALLFLKCWCGSIGVLLLRDALKPHF